MDTEFATGGGFSHEAVLYRQPAQYRSAVLGFVRDGLARSEPVLRGAARGRRGGHPRRPGRAPGPGLRGHGPARPQPGPDHPRGLGLRGPARRPAGPVRQRAGVAGPLRGRDPRRRGPRGHGQPGLRRGAGGRACAPTTPAASRRRSRPTRPGRTRCCARRTGPGTAPTTRPGASARAARGPLSRPPDRAQRLDYTSDLRSVRAAVARYAQDAGLSADRLPDLVIAVGEVIANTLRHTAGGGTVSPLAHPVRGDLPGQRHGPHYRPAGGPAPPARAGRPRAVGRQPGLRPGRAPDRGAGHDHPDAHEPGTRARRTRPRARRSGRAGTCRGPANPPSHRRGRRHGDRVPDRVADW